MTDKKRVLVVDDEPDLVQMMKLRLEADGYEVLTASDGQGGLQRAQNEKPDLIILDLMMPKMDGYKVCTMLKRDTRHQNIPIVLFTARADTQDEKLGFECGANAYIRKPFEPAELLATIRKWIG